MNYKVLWIYFHFPCLLYYGTLFFPLYTFSFFSKNLIFSWNDFQVEGLQRPCPGSLDKTPPKESLWKTYPHRLFFGRDSTHSWGPGGAAFLNPESKIQDKAYLCLHRITYDICYPALFYFFYISPLSFVENSSLIRKYFLCEHGTSKLAFQFVLFSNFSHRLEQFNDVLLQENDSSYNMSSPLFDLDDLISFTSKESNSLEVPMVCDVFYA